MKEYFFDENSCDILQQVVADNFNFNFPLEDLDFVNELIIRDGINLDIDPSIALPAIDTQAEVIIEPQSALPVNNPVIESQDEIIFVDDDVWMDDGCDRDVVMEEEEITTDVDMLDITSLFNASISDGEAFTDSQYSKMVEDLIKDFREPSAWYQPPTIDEIERTNAIFHMQGFGEASRPQAVSDAIVSAPNNEEASRPHSSSDKAIDGYKFIEILSEPSLVQNWLRSFSKRTSFIRFNNVISADDVCRAFDEMADYICRGRGFFR